MAGEDGKDLYFSLYSLKSQEYPLNDKHGSSRSHEQTCFGFISLAQGCSQLQAKARNRYRNYPPIRIWTLGYLARKSSL